MSSAQPEELLVEIYDKDIHKQDDYIGRVRVPGKDLLKASEKSLPVLTQDGAAIRGKDGQITMLTIIITSPLSTQSQPAAVPSPAPVASPAPASSPGPAASVTPAASPAMTTSPNPVTVAPATQAAPNAQRSSDAKSTPRPVAQVPASDVTQKGSPTDPRKPEIPAGASQAEVLDEPTIQMRVVIKEVENLPKMDVVGTCDPYAVATIGSKRFVTETVWNSYYAKWSKECDFEVSKAAGSLMVVEVFDKDKMGKDDLIGKVTVDVLQLARSDAAFAQNGVLEKRLPVLDKSGAAVRGKNGLITMLSLGFRKIQNLTSTASPPGAETAARTTETKGKSLDSTSPIPTKSEVLKVDTGASISTPAGVASRTLVEQARQSPATPAAPAPDTLSQIQTPVQAIQKSPSDAQHPASNSKTQPSPESKSAGLSASEPVAMKLILKGVENLPKKDLIGTCDAYAIATIGTKQRFTTDVVWNSYYAKWNKEFDIHVGASFGEALRVEVLDKDKIGKDDLIGEVNVDLHLLLRGDLARAENGYFEKAFPVQDKSGVAVRGKNGFVTMLTLGFRSVTGLASASTAGMKGAAGQQQTSLSPQGLLPVETKNDKARERQTPPMEDSGRSSLASPQVGSVAAAVSQSSPSIAANVAKGLQSEQSPAMVSVPKSLNVLLKEVEHLPKKDTFGTCDAFASISINGSQRFSTDVVWDSYFAKWNQQFELLVGPSVGETLLVEVYDKDKSSKDDLIGHVSVDLRPMVEGQASAHEWLEKRYPVLDKKGIAVRGKSGFITMITLGFRSVSDINAADLVTIAKGKTIKDDEGKLAGKSPPADEMRQASTDLSLSKDTNTTVDNGESNVSSENAIDLELRLNMDIKDIQDMSEFKGQVVKDVAKAAAIDPAGLRVSSVRAGSVIVDLALSNDSKDTLGRGAQEIAGGLEKQAKDSDSELLAGKYTCKTISLTVKRTSPEVGKSGSRESEELDAPKTSNHAQRVAAKLYSENSDLLARINALTQKLHQADLGDNVENQSDLSLEELVDILLTKLNEEKLSRYKADAAFDMAMEEATRQEKQFQKELDEATIEVDLIKSEMQIQKDAYEEQLATLKLAESSIAEKLRESDTALTRANGEKEAILLQLSKAQEEQSVQAQNLKNVKTEVEKLKKQLDEEHEAHRKTESALATMARDLELASNSAVADNSKEILESLKSAEAKNKDLKEQLSVEVERSKELDVKLTQALRAESQLKVDLESTKEQLGKVTKSQEDLIAKLAQTENKLKEGNAVFERKISELEEQLIKAKPEQHLLAADCERLRLALGTEQRAKAEQEERISQLQDRVVALQGDLERARLERRELEAIVSSLREELNDGSSKRERESVSSSTARTGALVPPRTPATATRPYSSGSPAVHLFMAGALSGTPGKVAKILLGSSERHRLATSDYLASLLENTVEINRVGKGLQPEDMAEIASYVLSHPRIERMFLSGNNLGVGGARQLADLLSRSTLKLQRLDLRHNNLGNQGCALLMESLAANESLTRLDLSANGLTPAAAAPIAAAVRASRCLVRLDLRHNELGDAGATELADALRCGAGLLHLDLSANAIGLKGAEVCRDSSITFPPQIDQFTCLLSRIAHDYILSYYYEIMQFGYYRAPYALFSFFGRHWRVRF